jgi:hypothetical protein
MLRIYLDAETLPPERDDPLIQHIVAKDDEEEYRKLALSSQYARILCVGMIIEEDGRILRQGVLGRDKNSNNFHLDSAKTLRSFWSLLRQFNTRQDLLVGFNLLDFDLHLITTQSVIRKIKPSIEIPFARYRCQPVYDLMWQFTHWKSRISLDEVAKVLGLNSSKSDGVNGSRVYDLFHQGRHKEIEDYCMRDVILNREIYCRSKFLEQAADGAMVEC